MVVVYRDPTLCPPRSPSRKPPLNLPLGRDHCKTKDIQATTTVIPAKAGASADGTSIQRGREKGKDAQIFGSRTRSRSCAKNPFAQRKRAEPRHPRRPPPNPVHSCKCPKRRGGSRTAPYQPNQHHQPIHHRPTRGRPLHNVFFGTFHAPPFGPVPPHPNPLPRRRPLRNPVIPADAGIQNQQSTPFLPIPATTTVPFARRGCTNP